MAQYNLAANAYYDICGHFAARRRTGAQACTVGFIHMSAVCSGANRTSVGRARAWERAPSFYVPRLSLNPRSLHTFPVKIPEGASFSAMSLLSNRWRFPGNIEKSVIPCREERGLNLTSPGGVARIFFGWIESLCERKLPQMQVHNIQQVKRTSSEAIKNDSFQKETAAGVSAARDSVNEPC